MFVTEVTNPNDWSVFVCVVGPGFDSTVCVYVGGVVDVECGLFFESRCVWVDCQFVKWVWCLLSVCFVMRKVVSVGVLAVR